MTVEEVILSVPSLRVLVNEIVRQEVTLSDGTTQVVNLNTGQFVVDPALLAEVVAELAAPYGRPIAGDPEVLDTDLATVSFLRVRVYLDSPTAA
jgi:hypothetical protein